MNSPEDEIPLPSEGVLSDAESAKQLREDMCRQYVEGMKQLRDQLIQARATNAKMETQLEGVASALLIANKNLDAAKAPIAPSLSGPFYALEAKETTSKITECLVVTDAQAVCEGNFSVLARCNNWKDAVFVAYACNRALGLPGVRFVVPKPKKPDWPDKPLAGDGDSRYWAAFGDSPLTSDIP